MQIYKKKSKKIIFTQKIILGKKGAKIKEDRTKSQNEISKVLNVKVHLYINVIKSNAD